jgi:Ca2+-transporting ATPase
VGALHRRPCVVRFSSGVGPRSVLTQLESCTSKETLPPNTNGKTGMRCRPITITAELAADAVRGLSAAEARCRLTVRGPNELAQAAATSRFTIFVRQFASLVIWILIVAATVSALMGERIDAIAIVAIIVLNAVVGFLQEYRAETAVAELKRMTAPKARVLRDGMAATVPAATLVPGDLLLVEAGDLVAADARLIEEAVSRRTRPP